MVHDAHQFLGVAASWSVNVAGGEVLVRDAVGSLPEVVEFADDVVNFGLIGVVV